VKRLTLEDLPSPGAFEAVRARLRERLIEHKRPRRVALGDRVTLVFEDRETVRWQVLEMARVERLRERAALQHELDVYNELVPGEGSLSATLFIEITDVASVRPELDRLIGLDEHVSLELGEGAGALRVRARFDPKQLDEERIAAVQYVRFPLDAAARARFGDPAVPARLRVDHPRYRAETLLAPETRASLARDFAGGPPPFLGVAIPAAGPDASTSAGELLAQSGRVRALRPPAPRAAAHVVLEPVDAVSFLDADPGLLLELAALAQELARGLAERHGACRLEAELAGPLRWHLLAG
jgi:Protein of unknown function (DUF3501)